MNREEIIDKIYELIRETLNSKDLEIDLNSNIIEDLEMDSVDGITLIMDLEELFGITIEDEEFANFTTVSYIVDYVENLNKHS